MLRTFLILTATALLAALPAQAASFDSDGVKIHYQVEGRGEPVVLIHGLHASAQMNWAAPGIIADLAKTYRIIALDCRGHGQSDKPEAEGSYGVKMVEDVVRLMDHLKLRSAHIVGYSMGGMIGLKLAVLHPDRVRSTTLGGMGWMEEGSRQQDFWAGNDRRGGNAALIRGFTEFATTAAQVKAIRTPISVVIGDRDPCRLLYVVPLLKLRPEIPEHVIAEAGHIGCIAKPEFKTGLRTALARAEGHNIRAAEPAERPRLLRRTLRRRQTSASSSSSSASSSSGAMGNEKN
jgi:pimeloyl-ACP methyl ester carboxylesterase